MCYNPGRFIVNLLLGLMLPGAALADVPHWHSPQFLQKSFIEIALRSEYSQRGQVVRKWNKPILVWLDHQVADQELHTELVGMHLKHLQQLTGHSIRLVDEEQQANLKVVFTRQEKWPGQVRTLFGAEAAKVVRGAVCMANFRVNGRYEIVSAGVIIPVDQARMHGKLVSCIVEELTQVMGLPNDSDQVYPSIFNDRTPEQLLSGLDGLLLRMLYQSQIKTGMNQQQVQPIINNVIQKWQQEGTISAAARDVRQGELYPLLGY